MSMFPTSPANPGGGGSSGSGAGGGVGGPISNTPPPPTQNDILRRVVAAAVNPADITQAQILFGTGEIRGVNSPGSTQTLATFKDFWGASQAYQPTRDEVAVDLAVISWSPKPSGFVLSNKGRLMPFGDATVPEGALLFGFGRNTMDFKAVAFSMKDAVSGAWVDTRGFVETFGTNPTALPDLTDAQRAVAGFTDQSCVDWSFDAGSGRWLILSNRGEIKASPNATVNTACSAMAQIGTRRSAVAIEYDWVAQRGYVIDSQGTIYPIGFAVSLPADPYWPSPGNVADIAVASWGEDSVFTYWVFDVFGGSYMRVATTPPRASIKAPVGLPLKQRLTASGSGVFRLRRVVPPADTAATLPVTDQIVYTAHLDVLTAALDKLIGPSGYSVEGVGGYDIGDPLDVEITLPGGAQDALEVTGDSGGGVVLVETQASTTAIIADTSRPTIEWVYADDEDDPQGSWEVQVWKSDAGLGIAPPPNTPSVSPVWSASGASRLQRSVKITQPLSDATSYRAYVRVQEGGGRWSDWDYVDFQLELDLPVVPTTTLSADEANAAIVVELAESVPAERSNLVWLERRAAGREDWDMVRGSGRTVMTGLFDDFKRPDSTDLGYPWLTSGTPLRITAEQVQPLVASLGRKPQVGKLASLGRPTWTDRRMWDALELSGAVTPDWEYHNARPASGGNTFRDQFMTPSVAAIPAAPDGTIWTELRGRFASYGSGVWRTHSSTDTGQSIAVADMGGRIGSVSTIISRAPGSVDAFTRVQYGRMGIALAMDAAGAGYAFYSELSPTTENLGFYFVRLAATGAQTELHHWTPETDGWGEHRITVEFGATSMKFEARDLDNDLLYTGTDTHDGGMGNFFGLYGGSISGFGGGQAFKTGIMQWRDFRWVRHPTIYTLPGSKSQVGAWSTEEDGTASPMLEVGSSVTVETAPDAALSVYFGGDPAGEIEFRAGTGAGVSLAVASGQIGIYDGATKMALVGVSGHTTEEELTIEVSHDNLQVLLGGDPLPLTPYLATHPSVVASDWTSTNSVKTDAGAEVKLVASANGTVTLESVSQALPAGAAGWSCSGYLDVKGPNGTTAQGYIAYVTSGSITQLVLGPKRPMVGTPAVDRVSVRGVIPAGATHIRYGVIFTSATAADEFFLNQSGRLGLDTINLPASFRLGTKWTFKGSRGVAWKKPRWRPTTTLHAATDVGVSAPGTEISNNPVGGRASSARYLPVLSPDDALLAAWGELADDTDDLRVAVDAALTWTRSRNRSWFADSYTYVLGSWVDDTGTDPTSVNQLVRNAQGATFEPNGRVLSSSTAFSAISISVPATKAGEKLAVGLVVTSGSGEGFSYKRPGDASYIVATDAWGESFANHNVADGSYATAAVAHIPLEVTGAPQTVLIQVQGSVSLDWWGIESPSAAPRTILLGIPVGDPPGTEVARNTALAEVADLYSEVEYLGVLEDDYFLPLSGDPVPTQVLLNILTAALGGATTSRLCDALAYHSSDTPGAEADLLGPGAVIAGADSFTAPTTGVKLVVEEDNLTADEARIRSLTPLSGAWVYDNVVDIHTGASLETYRSVGLRVTEVGLVALVNGAVVHTFTRPTGNLNGVQLVSLGSKFDTVSLGGEALTIRDYEAKPGVLYEYRLRVSNFNMELFSEPLVLGSVKAPVCGYWIKDPLDPGLNMRVQRETEDLEYSIAEEQGVFDPPGRSRMIVVTGALKAPRLGAQTFAAASEAEREALLRVLRSGSTLLFQTPRGAQFYVRFGPDVVVNSIADAYGRPLYQVSVSEGYPVDVP